MAAGQQSVTVVQHYNIKFSDSLPEHPADNPRFVYVVTKTVNYLGVRMDEILKPDRLQDLIDLGINVTVNPQKD